MGRSKRKVDILDNPMTMRALLKLLFTAAAALPAAMATEFTVGDATGWDFAPTSSYYSDWASGLKFLPGDKLVFKYLPSAHNVQEVTEANYAACNSVSPIAEYESGNDIITLPKPGTHYYICGFLGHCDQGGMKFKATINSPKATNSSSPSPSPSPAKTPQLPSPMTSIIPQLPGGETHPHLPHGHGHGAPTLLLLQCPPREGIPVLPFLCALACHSFIAYVLGHCLHFPILVDDDLVALTQTFDTRLLDGCLCY